MMMSSKEKNKGMGSVCVFHMCVHARVHAHTHTGVGGRFVSLEQVARRGLRGK